MLFSDRFFKNNVDVIICLNNSFPGGISKRELLNFFDGILIHKVNLDSLLHLAKGFKPQELNGLSMDEYAIIFDKLVTGLISDSVYDDDIFINNNWREKI